MAIYFNTVHVYTCILYSSVATDVYSSSLSRSWRYRVVDVKLLVRGAVAHLPPVSYAVSSQCVRGLVLRCVPPVQVVVTAPPPSPSTQSPFLFLTLPLLSALSFSNISPFLSHLPPLPLLLIPLHMKPFRLNFFLLLTSLFPLTLSHTSPLLLSNLLSLREILMQPSHFFPTLTKHVLLMTPTKHVYLMTPTRLQNFFPLLHLNLALLLYLLL